MPSTAAGWAALGQAAAGSAAVYGAVSMSQESKKARKAAEKAKEREFEFMERQAGEYSDLSKQQIEYQAQLSNIRTLADLIQKTKQTQQPRVFTLPPAKSYTPVQKINQAIDEFLTK